jgi:circadian clock protein KaiC
LAGATTLLIREHHVLTTTTLALETDLVSLLAASVLWLQQVTFRGRLYRVLSVPKMRFSAHDVSLREFTITAPEGLQVLAPFESEEGLLAGIARRQGQPVEGRAAPPPAE